MAPQKHEDHYGVIISVVPPPRRHQQQIQSNKVQRKTQEVHKDDDGRTLKRVTKIYEAEELMIKTKGPSASKAKAEYSSTKEYVEKRGQDVHGRSSNQSTMSFKAEGFVDRKTARMAFKVEVKHISTKKSDYKKQGYTHEYQTQVKHKHVAYPIKDAPKSSSSNNKRINYH